MLVPKEDHKILGKKNWVFLRAKKVEWCCEKKLAYVKRRIIIFFGKY